MKKSILAIHGGEKTITKPLKIYNSIGIEEVNAAKNVVESGVLSQYLGCWMMIFLVELKCKSLKESVRHILMLSMLSQSTHGLQV